MKRTARQAAAILVTLALGASACSRNTSETATTGGDEKVAKIGVIVPLSGSLSAYGLGIKNSVDLAVKQANDSGKVKGWRFVVDAQDDAGKPEQGASAANKLASDPTVAAVVGTYNSSVAQQVAPILQRARIAQISPANTNPTLTRGPDTANPVRVSDTYFRVCTIDSLQAPFAADYAFKTANLKTVVSVHDKKTYGQGIAEAFEKRFKELGGQVLSQETVSENDRDFGGLVTKVTGLKPDFVFYGGEYPAAAPLSAQLGQGGFTGPLMGGDGIQSAEFTQAGGRPGDLGTNVGAPIEKLPAAKRFTDAYQAAGYKEGFEAYGALSYDAGNIIVEALAKVLPNAADVQTARDDIVKAIGATANYEGVAGATTFDQYGDTSNKVLTVYKVEGGAWKDAYSGTFGGA